MTCRVTYHLTMDAPYARHCTKCAELKSLNEFSKASGGKYGRKSWCKACDAHRHAIQYVPHPEGRMGPRRPPLPLDTIKTCTKCLAAKPLGDFSLSRQAKGTRNAVYRSDCKQCCSQSTKEWHKRNPGRVEANHRRRHLNAYGLTRQDYVDLLHKQGGGCAICGTNRGGTRNGKVLRMAVDHDHKTGTYRGILCNRCNRAIGLLGDDPTLLRKAINYLMAARSKG